MPLRRAEPGGGRVEDDEVGARSRVAEPLEEAARRSRTVDEADREAARREVRDVRRQPLDALAEIDERHLARGAGTLAGVDDEDAGAALDQRGAEPLEENAAAGDVRIRDDRNEARRRAREHLAQ